MSNFINTFLNDVKENVNGFIAVAVCEIETGLSYGSLTVKEGFDPELASAYNIEVVKSKLKAIKALGLDEEIDDVLITLRTQLHILDVSKDAKYMIYLSVDSTKANLGITRSMLRKYKAELEANLA